MTDTVIGLVAIICIVVAIGLGIGAFFGAIGLGFNFVVGLI